MSNQLMIQGKPVAFSNFGGAVNEKGTLVGARAFIATKAGLTPEEIEGLNMKDTKALAIKSGTAESDIKLWGKEYDSQRERFYSEAGLVNGMLAADPNYRKSLKVNVNAKGETIGATCVYRRERSKKATQAAEILALKATIAKLTAGLPTSA